ncbi:hypothetical protein N657DRAFT_576958 [Parathielavia appendiculata]|uniref:SANT domain-containing protein n=1 Tax=Parathielavia appendiculata TaxID=2587402 RepID=A0AAN6TW35_9PEZI|nr:hypothetical protein N657DRAFT_576958 [Parathielavia appendiculata]
MDVYFEREISKTEAELKKLKDAVDKVPMRIVQRYATALHEAMLSVLNDPVSLVDMVGPIPEGFTFPCPKPEMEVNDQEMPDMQVQDQEDRETAPATREPSAIPTVEEADESSLHPPEPQPKVEEMDTDGSGLPPVPTLKPANPSEQDAEMQDVAELPATVGPAHRSVSINGPVDGEGPALFPHPFDHADIGRSSASPDEESEDRTEDDGSIYGTVEAAREFSATPPTEDLPIYNVKPWFQSRRVRKLADKSSEFGDFFLAHIRDQTISVTYAQEDAKRDYAKKYESYLRFTMSDDPAAVKSREYFISSGTQQVSNGKPASSDSKPEGGRRAAGRFSTELDLEAAIQESIREHQERKEREERAQKEKYRSDKEAVIPDMFWTDEEREQASFYDASGLIPLEKVVATWQVVPHHINFTPEEAERFEKAYLESPKQWGKISKEVGARDPGTCILYYYAMKRELNLKDKLKKQPRRRKKGSRAKQRSSALVSELGNTENETEDTAGQDTGENGERRRPPRRAAAPVWPSEATSNAESDGATPAPTPGRRRAGTAAEAKSEAGAEKSESKRGGRKPRQPRADKEAKAPKLLAQAPPGATPLAVPVKTGRSRANSKAQVPDWASPQTPVDLAARIPLSYEVPHPAMQPPLHQVQQSPLPGPDRGMPSISSAMSEVMAPPSLRPEPPPLPPASVPTFEISQSVGPERIRTPGQASSYWSVSETTDFPGLLRAFGTDWVKIANHMQTKTATMVKNYYVRQTKEGGKPEWEQIATEADAKAQRGEKRPAPPTPTQGPRKRYDVSSTGHRPLAAAEPDETLLTKVEPQNQPFQRFQVPIAQATPVSHPLVQPAPVGMTTSLATAAAAQSTVPGTPATQTMSPHTHPLRPPAPAYTYPEREAEVPAQAQQPARISQKPVSATVPVPPISEPAPRPAAWVTDLGQQFSLLSQAKEARDARDARERQRLQLAQRESPRPVERASLRLKQEPDQPLHHQESYAQFQPPQRPISTRVDTTPLGRQPEPARAPAPVPQSYAPPVHAQPVRNMIVESVPGPQVSHMPPNELPLSSMQRQPPVSMQEQYGAVPVSAPPTPSHPQAQPQPPPAPSRAPERKVNIMSLLNDDDPPQPKRVADVPLVKRNSTPQPQSMARQPPPTSAPLPSRREVDQGYPYARTPAPAPQSTIPPLKPYHTQSPQPQHMRVPSTGMASSVDAAADAQRDYYARHPYPSQHSVGATKSPQTREAHHYAQHGQHVQQHPQPTQMGYQGQQPYQPYQVSQPHTASPTTQYAPHPSMSSRREPQPPSGREPWPQQQPQPMHQHQQLPQQLPPQQQQHHHHQHQPHPSQSGWPPSHQAPPKAAQPVPAQSAWGAQHGGVQAKPAASSPHPPQQHHTWPTSGPNHPQPHPLSLRDSRGSSVYESQSPTAGMPHHPHHQHHNSLGGGRYAPGPQDAVRRGEQQHMPQQAGQPPYARYTSTPGPPAQQGRESVRSFTPVSGGGFDHRGPPPGPPGPPPSQQQQSQPQPQQQQQQQQYMTQAQQQQQQQDLLRDQHMREAQMREMQGQRDPRDHQSGGGGGGAILGRQLRPGVEGQGPRNAPPGAAGLYEQYS